MSDSPSITQLLRRLELGDSAAEAKLYEAVYPELRALAYAQFRGERFDHTLQPTALLHEAYLNLIRAKNISWVDRGHFFALAARTMRRVLISHARARNAIKRSAGGVRVDLDGQACLSVTRDGATTILALDVALDKLRTVSPRAYQVVELRYFAGLEFDDIANSLNVSSRTCKRDWNLAKVWLYRELQGPDLG